MSAGFQAATSVATPNSERLTKLESKATCVSTSNAVGGTDEQSFEMH